VFGYQGRILPVFMFENSTTHGFLAFSIKIGTKIPCFVKPKKTVFAAISFEIFSVSNEQSMPYALPSKKCQAVSQ
jgi:hypothetical protein